MARLTPESEDILRELANNSYHTFEVNIVKVLFEEIDALREENKFLKLETRRLRSPRKIYEENDKLREENAKLKAEIEYLNGILGYSKQTMQTHDGDDEAAK